MGAHESTYQSHHRNNLTVLLLAAILAASQYGCASDNLSGLGGTLVAVVIHPDEQTETVDVFITGMDESRSAVNPVSRPETRLEMHALKPGLWDAHVRTRDAHDVPLRSLRVADILIQNDRATEIVIDLLNSTTPPECDPENVGELPICALCVDGNIVTAPSDPACEVITCEASSSWALLGDNDATGYSQCVRSIVEHQTDNQCEAPGLCAVPAEEDCTPVDLTLLEAGICELISNCESGSPTLDVVPDGTPCGFARRCWGGVCVPDDPESGCADQTREGFLSFTDYPNIAGCSGGWSVGGITRGDLTPTCNHQSGNNSPTPTGEGCSPADLCAPGWHVCQGKDEVDLNSQGSCEDAVPPGAPNKSLFFAVAQSSEARSVCDDSEHGNDVFGCGNLGSELPTNSNCEPLDRVLASMHPNSCGFNEAEPPLGPWVCQGNSTSHLREGMLVQKNGCTGQSCAYDGIPLGNADKGGVLCCIDP